MHRPAVRRSVHARGSGAAGMPEQTLRDGARSGACERRALAGAQGRHALLRERRLRADQRRRMRSATSSSLRNLTEEQSSSDATSCCSSSATAAWQREEASARQGRSSSQRCHTRLRNPLALIQMQSELLLRAPELRRARRASRTRRGSSIRWCEAQSAVRRATCSTCRALRTGKLALERQLLPLPLVIADSIGALREEAEKNKITLERRDHDRAADRRGRCGARASRSPGTCSRTRSSSRRAAGASSRAARARGNELARLDVEDNGQGIAPEVLPQDLRMVPAGRVRLDAPPRAGMGIGLALVKQLVELHGGRVRGAFGGDRARVRASPYGCRCRCATPVRRAAAARRCRSQQPAGASPASVSSSSTTCADNADAMAELLQLEGAAMAHRDQRAGRPSPRATTRNST